MAFIITTTGTPATVVLNDLGARTFVHPVISYDLETEYTSSELSRSSDLQDAITNGEITVVNSYGDSITDTETISGVSDKGVPSPKMTTAQMNAISNPSEGLLVWDGTTHDLKGYDGDNWVYLGGRLEQVYGIYTFDLNGNTDNLGNSGANTSPTITNDIHNITNIYRVNPDQANRVISGILAPPAGVNRVIHISNVSNILDIKFDHDNSSTPENGIMLRDGVDKAIKGNETASFWYDHLEPGDGSGEGIGRWKVFNRVG